jgi:flavin-binding protein dodecin
MRVHNKQSNLTESDIIDRFFQLIKCVKFAGGREMSIIRNIDVTMQSEIGFDDACRQAVVQAAKTLRGILTFKANEFECVVEHDKVIAYRVTGKIVFVVER